MQFKSIFGEIKADMQENTFEGYASSFGNIDSYNDIIEKGAFKKTISENKNRIKVLWQHNVYEPIGLPSAMEEDSKGLYVKARICETDTGKKAMTLLREGVINEMSIGYDVVKDDYDRNKSIRLLKEVKLWEFSLVTFAANEKATVTGVKEFNTLNNYLDLIDELKAGRMLSQSNINKVKAAIQALQALLEQAEPSEDTPKSKESHKEDIDPKDIQLILAEIKKFKN